MKEGETEVYPLAVKAEAVPIDEQRPVGENQNVNSLNSQITQAVFEKKENGEYRVRVVKQILWVNGTRYELQEIYGIGNSVDSDFDGNDPGKECVICLSEPRDTTVLPCRHMVSVFCCSSFHSHIFQAFYGYFNEYPVLIFSFKTYFSIFFRWYFLEVYAGS